LPAEREELELAAELLELTSEAELEQFLGDLIERGRKAVGTQIKSGAPGEHVAAGVKYGAPALVVKAMLAHPTLAQWAPVAGAATGLVSDRLINWLTKEELEMLSVADRELEIARRYLLFAKAALADAAEHPFDDPEEAAATAFTDAARSHAPWLVPDIEDIFDTWANGSSSMASTGEWLRRGSTIILEDVVEVAPEAPEEFLGKLKEWTGTNPRRLPATPSPPAPRRTGEPRTRAADIELEDLRRRAKKDRTAADALWARYQGMSDFELFRRFADEADETASAVIRQRYPSTEAALKKILGKNYRPPHSATTVLRRGDREIRGQVNSGGIDRMTPKERSLGFPKNMLATHTEARAIRQAGLQRGDFLEIRGQYDPCSSCVRAMQEAATRSGATIRYWWPGGSVTFP
jgi:hypothetical protein